MRWLMGTACEATVSASDPDGAANAAFDEIAGWERVLSLYIEGSELNALNASAGKGPFRASPKLYAAVAAALRLAEETGGAFDPTILPVLRRGAAARRLVGWAQVRLDPAARTIELPEAGMGLDSGAWGKGWALDRAAEILRARGAKSAFINFGGQIMTLGRPGLGALWRVELPGLPEPLRLAEGSVATSGDSERPGHIVSPFDGQPVRRAAAATAVLPSAMDADAWSTALYVLGRNPPSFRGRSFFVKNVKGGRS